METLITVNGSKFENKIKTLIKHFNNSKFSTNEKEDKLIREEQLKQAIINVLNHSILY